MTDPRMVLLTNDDGIDAAGIDAMAAAFEAIPDMEVWIVAPDRERSTCSNGMSLSRPVFVRELGPRRFAVDGLPVDCVYLATYGLMPGPPDLVISGINCGPNLGSDVIFSGTVAGARQAALQDIHGIAVSLISGDDYSRAAASTAEIAVDIMGTAAAPPVLLNLNFPAGDYEGPCFGPLGERNYPRQVSKRVAPLTRDTYYWLGGPPVEDGLIEGTDGWLISRGIASATLLTLNQTDSAAMADPGVLASRIRSV